MPIEHLSYSTINQYINCGLKLKFRKVENLKPEFISESLIFGTCIHRVLAEFNQERLKENTLPLDELKDRFEHIWIDAVKNNGEIKFKSDYMSCLNQGKELLRVFYERNPKQSEFKVFEIENRFDLDIEGLTYPIIGYIDLLEVDEDGNFLITEYKTSARAYSNAKVDMNEQITLYHMAVQALYPEKQVISKIDCLIRTKSPKFEQYYTHRDQHDHNRFIKTAREVAKGIEANVFIPNTTSWQCNNCEYKKACKDWFKP